MISQPFAATLVLAGLMFLTTWGDHRIFKTHQAPVSVHSPMTQPMAKPVLPTDSSILFVLQ
jgi:hypothetical protein